MEEIANGYHIFQLQSEFMPYKSCLTHGIALVFLARWRIMYEKENRLWSQADLSLIPNPLIITSKLGDIRFVTFELKFVISGP